MCMVAQLQTIQRSRTLNSIHPPSTNMVSGRCLSEQHNTREIPLSRASPQSERCRSPQQPQRMAVASLCRNTTWAPVPSQVWWRSSSIGCPPLRSSLRWAFCRHARAAAPPAAPGLAARQQQHRKQQRTMHCGGSSPRRHRWPTCLDWACHQGTQGSCRLASCRLATRTTPAEALLTRPATQALRCPTAGAQQGCPRKQPGPCLMQYRKPLGPRQRGYPDATWQRRQPQGVTASQHRQAQCRAGPCPLRRPPHPTRPSPSQRSSSTSDL